MRRSTDPTTRRRRVAEAGEPAGCQPVGGPAEEAEMLPVYPRHRSAEGRRNCCPVSSANLACHVREGSNPAPPVSGGSPGLPNPFK